MKIKSSEMNRKKKIILVCETLVKKITLNFYRTAVDMR